MKKYVLVIGGTKFSGAEKRLIQTARLLKAQHNLDVRLIMRESLMNSLTYNKNMFISKSELESFSKIFTIKDQIFGKKYNLLYKISRLKFLFLPQVFWGKYVHIALLSPFMFPTLLFAKRVFFEITSPDIAEQNFVKSLLKLKLEKFKLISVSESVNNKLFGITNIDKIKFNERVKGRTRPYSEVECVEEDVISEKNNTVIYAHRLLKRKNPDIATKVFKRLAIEFPTWEFRIYGDGPLKKDIDESMLGCNSNVSSSGYSNDMKMLLQKAKIFISIIEPDSYPSQSVIEALSQGCAVVIGNVGYGAKTFVKGNGFACEINEDDVYAQLKKILLMREAEINQLCLNSIKLKEKEFSLDKYISESYDIIFN
ncbi:glycosyltransferase family 4 protein [Thalassotalea agariperforans]